MSDVPAARWVLAAPLGLFWLLVAHCNLRAFLPSKGPRVSYAPLLGGLAGAGAVLLIAPGWWALVPMVLDLGCLPYLLLVLVASLATPAADPSDRSARPAGDRARRRR